MRTVRSIVISSAFLLAGMAAQAVTLKSVIASDQAFAPGPPGAVVGTLIGLFRERCFNDAGQAAIMLDLQVGPGGVTSLDDSRLVRFAPDGTPEVIAAQGASAPGTEGTFSAAIRPAMSEAGEVTFSASLRTLVPPTVTTANNDTAYLTDTLGTLELLGREQQPSPGFPGTFAGAFVPSIGAGGRLALMAHIGSNDVLYLRDDAGALQLVALEGQPAAGMPGYNYSTHADPADIRPAVSPSGDVFFYMGLDDPLVSGTQNLRAIYRADVSGTVEPVIVSNDPAPGGGLLGSPGQRVRANGVGQLLFTVGTTVWIRNPDDSIVQLIVPGTQVPGEPAGDTYASGMGDLVFNDLGQTAFVGGVVSPSGNYTAIFGPTPSGIGVIAGEGKQAPTLPAGVTFVTLADTVARWLGDDGGVVFAATLTGPGITTADDNVLYYHAPDGTYTVVAREGQEVSVGPGDLRTISILSQSTAIPPTTGPYQGSFELNAQHQVLFRTVYTDGSEGYVLAELLPQCANGRDDDADGYVDYADDPGCADDTEASIENPKCQNGLDDDGDGGIDFDGGASVNGGTPLGSVDPQCTVAHRRREASSGCGLGAELLLALVALRFACRRSAA